MNETSPNGLTLAESARTLAAARADGILSTLRAEDGVPYGSVVDYWYQDDGDALLFLSRLAEHRRYLDADPRASLLIVADANGLPTLAGARLTLIGRALRETQRERWRDGYLARHPQAAAYIDFSDFDFYRLRVDSARFIAGFGRMGWLTEDRYRGARPDPLAAVAAGAIAHMNDDHGDSLRDYARAFGAIDPAGECRMTGLDRYGFDLFCQTERGESVPLRIGFDQPLADPGELRATMAKLAARAREQLAKK